MADVEQAEDRARARQLLRTAYRDDVELLTQDLTNRVKRSEFDANDHFFEDRLSHLIARHPRVTESVLVGETLAYSENRGAILSDFLEDWTPEIDGPWDRFEPPDSDEPDGKLSQEAARTSAPSWEEGSGSAHWVREATLPSSVSPRAPYTR